VAKLSIYKYVRTDKGWRYCKAAFHSNGKIKPNVVIVRGVEEKHTEGRYFLNFNGQWIDAGVDAREAQRRRQLRLNQIEYARLSRESSVAATAERPSVVEFPGPKVIKDEVDAYLADLELTRRPARTVQSKRKYLGDFVGLIGKEFADEYRREDVLKYKNKLQDEGFAPKTIDTRMMAVVTFFNRWLRIKLRLDAKDWPETHDNDPEPYTDEEAARLEDASLGEINLLIRAFRQTGCRDMELAHLKDTDLLDSKEIYIREKPCTDCKDCRSRGNIWRPKTLKSTRKIPVGDALFAELKERGRGLLFPNDQGQVDGHLLRKIKEEVGDCVQGIKLHRWRDTYITNKLRDQIDIVTVATWAGHDDINVTRSYAAWLDSQSKAARDFANREDTRYRKTGTQGD
jgi:site-specific recombinase XerD